MRTIGEILRSKRLAGNISLEIAEKHLRIRSKFLSALEENDWSHLPALPYITGFLRNYSRFLGLNSDEMLAIFRRQYSEKKQQPVVPQGVASPLNEPIFRITPPIITVSIVTLFFTLFFGYLFLQYQTSINPPPLTLFSPQEGEVVASDTIVVSGRTDHDAVISVNDRLTAVSQGEFKTSVDLTFGSNTIVVEAANKNGKKRTIIRTVSHPQNSPIE